MSLNEVGGNPELFGVTPAIFHEHLLERQARWPFSLSATSTHDTKRSEDVRARINVLSEIPGKWRACVNRWAKLTRKYKIDVEGQLVPDRNEEYLFYQTLVGVWPLMSLDHAQYRTFCERVQEYMNKALREGKTHTSWVNPDQGYEEAMRQFVESILDRTRPNAFLDECLPFQQRVAYWGMWNALSQVVLKTTAPGVPDFYHGSELWDFSLVDPDNRRPVDYGMRATLVHALAECGLDLRPLARTLLAERLDGRIKLYTAMRALNFRRENRSLFQQGEYIPLDGRRTNQEHCCVFARLHMEQAVVTVVPRLVSSLTGNA